MKRKRYSVEQIIGKLREAEVMLSQGRTVKEVSRELGVTEQTYYRWGMEFHTFRPGSSFNYRSPAPAAILKTWIVHTDLRGPFPLPGGKDTLPLT